MHHHKRPRACPASRRRHNTTTITMENSRPPSSQSEKLDDKSDEEHLGSRSNSPPPSDAADIEKRAESQSPPSVFPQAGGQPDEKQAFLVKWDENEAANPRNYSARRKGFITFQLGMLALAASLGSSIISPAEPEIAAYIGVSEEVTVLAVSLYGAYSLQSKRWASRANTWISVGLCFGTTTMGACERGIRPEMEHDTSHDLPRPIQHRDCG